MVGTKSVLVACLMVGSSIGWSAPNPAPVPQPTENAGETSQPKVTEVPADSTPVATATATPSATAVATGTLEPMPTLSPEPTPTLVATATPTAEPAAVPAIESSVSPTSPAIVSTYPPMTVTVSLLNVRSGPGVRYPVVRTLRKGQNVTVVSREGIWVGIADNEYVSIKFLK